MRDQVSWPLQLLPLKVLKQDWSNSNKVLLPHNVAKVWLDLVTPQNIPAWLGASVTGQGAQTGMRLSSRDISFRDGSPLSSSSSFRISGAQHRMSLLCFSHRPTPTPQSHRQGGISGAEMWAVRSARSGGRSSLPRQRLMEGQVGMMHEADDELHSTAGVTTR